MLEKFTCIDLGTDYCPCHLAESGECILCSQLKGKEFCDCNNWNGVCVYSEYCNHNCKAREGRKTYECKVIEIKKYEDNILLIKFKISRHLAFELIKPGSYAFIRKSEEGYFDTPISIMDTNPEEEWGKMVIKVSGVKTKNLASVKEGEFIKLRGPYFNGIFGIKELNSLVDKKVLLLGRGIGLAPILPILKKLKRENNKITLLTELEDFNEQFIKNDLDKYDIEINEGSFIENGNLTDWAKDKINKFIEEEGNHIHIGGADITTYKVIEYINEIGENEIGLSCFNNFKMSCGEGICGACTIKYTGDKVRRYCKYQTDPRTVFKGRWLI